MKHYSQRHNLRWALFCHIHNYTEYNEEWNVFSAFNPSKCTHLEQWAADCAAPGEVLMGEYLSTSWVLMGSPIHFCESALSGSFQWTDSGVPNSSSYCNSEIAYTVKKNKKLRKLKSLRQAASADFFEFSTYFLGDFWVLNFCCINLK